jgi:hypothetical protein
VPVDLPDASPLEPDGHVPMKLIAMAAVAALGGFLFAFDSAIINGTVDANRHQYGLSPTILGFRSLSRNARRGTLCMVPTGVHCQRTENPQSCAAPPADDPEPLILTFMSYTTLRRHFK